MREDWINCKLGDLLKLKNGFAFKSSKYDKNGIPVLRIGDIKEWKVDSSEAKRIEENEEYDNYIVQNGDILIAMSGATTGKFGVYKSEEKAYQNQRVGNLIPHTLKHVNKNYIFYLLYSLKRNIEKDAYGGAQPNISAKKIENLDTTLAPLPIQRTIVTKIENLFASLDKGIADLKKAQEQLKVYRQAVLKKAFEGELTSTKIENRSISSLSNLVTKGASPKWQGYDYTNDESALLFITSENIREGFLSLEKEKYLPIGFNNVQKRSVLKKGDVLFNIVGASIGRAALYNLDKLSNINQAVALIRLNNEMSNQYLCYFLNSEGAKQEYLKKQVDVARANLSLQNVNDIEVPYCTIEEQKKIIKEIESRLSVCDKVERNIIEGLEKSEALRQSILKKAFEGKLLSEAEIEQCKQEADYEPASVLLEKIKKRKK